MHHCVEVAWAEVLTSNEFFQNLLVAFSTFQHQFSFFLKSWLVLGFEDCKDKVDKMEWGH